MSILSQFALAAEAFKEQSSAAIKACAHTIEDILADAQAISAAITELQESKDHAPKGKASHKDNTIIDTLQKAANQLENAVRHLMEQMQALEDLQPPEPPKVP